MFSYFRNLEIGVMVGAKDNDHEKVKKLIEEYKVPGTEVKVVPQSTTDHVWLFATIKGRDEKRLEDNFEVLRMLGMEIKF